MTILALEFSSGQRSVAVARHGQVLTEVREAGGYRATNAFHLIDSAMAKAGIVREEIDAIAIGLGPGSYTGIRAAIAVAQGWELATGVKLIGISSAEVLAAQAQSEGHFGRVNVVIDAQRSEFYLATWEITSTELRLITPLSIIARSEIEKLQQAGGLCVGPDVTPLLFPSAATLSQIAMSRNEFTAGKDLMPIYLRETTFVKAAPARY